MKPPTLILENVTIRLENGTTLLDDLNLEVRPGEVLLLTGPSGSGKSTLGRLLAGLLPRGKSHRVSGRLHHEGTSFDLHRENPVAAGYVFQNGALFDDLSAADNLAFVQAHGKGSRADEQEDGREGLPPSLLPPMDLDRPVSTLSGGEAMRLAIARTLTRNHGVMVYDEPNSGLDPDASLKLVELVCTLAKNSGRPAIVIAHHLHDFLPHCDRIFFLSPSTAHLMDVTERARTRGLLDLYTAEAGQRPKSEPESGPHPEKPTATRPDKEKPQGLAHYTLHYVLHYFWLLFASPSALLYLLCGMLLLGVTSTWFLFQHFPYKEFLTPLFKDKVLEALGFVLFRAVIPASACFLVAARGSAMLANDLGHRVYTRQHAAMHNLGIPTRRYFVAIPLAAMLAAVWLGTAMGMVVTSFAGWQTWSFLFPHESMETWRLYYLRRFLSMEGALWVSLKITLSGLGMGTATILCGLREKRSVLDVHRHSAQAIIASILVTLLVQTVIAIMEF